MLWKYHTANRFMYVKEILVLNMLYLTVYQTKQGIFHSGTQQ